MSNESAPRATPRLEQAFTWLTQAFFEGTLAKGSCAHCAVGNITAKANGIKTKFKPTVGGHIGSESDVPMEYYMRELKAGITNKPGHTIWTRLFMTDDRHGKQKVQFTREQAFDNAVEHYGEIEAKVKDFPTSAISQLGLADYLKYHMVILKGREYYISTVMEQYDIEVALAYELLVPTGYSAQELAQVENAFEKATKLHIRDYYGQTDTTIKNDQFNGLVAVMDVLCRLDGVDATPYKEAFEFKLDPMFEPAHPELIAELS